MESFKREVKYYECDRMGITHHSNYIRFMEEARIYVLDMLGYGFDRMEELGYGYAKMEEDGIVSPVMSVSCEYKKPTTFKDEIEISLKVKEMSELKITFSYVMKVKGVLVCKATSTHCFIENGRPFSFQKRWPELTEKLMEL